MLAQYGDLIERQQASPFRVRAYRRAADRLRGLDADLRGLLDRHGVEGLAELPDVGTGIAGAVEEIVRTGRLARLERLRGNLQPEELFRTVPGIGPQIARRLHDRLGAETLEGLEVAAHDGRLEAVRGVGRRRAAAIRASLDEMLKRRRLGKPPGRPGPGVGMLLHVDGEYRRGAESDRLPRIAPKRFNPEGRAWLPILHADRDGWHFTVLFSNTGRAHQLGRTRDWVVIYYYDDDEHEGQHTVVTETHGPQAGRRVVRGLEEECRRFYASPESPAENRLR